VTAKHFVIAAGGIENARLLLVSDSLGRCGLGNDRDLVGRFFMEHPHGRGGRVIGPANWRLMRSFRKRSAIGHDEAWLLAGSPGLQEATGALNGAITLAVRRPAGKPQFLIEQAYRGAKLSVAPTERGRALWHAYRGLGRLARTTLAPAVQWQRLHSGRAELAIVLRAEQSPNPDSRLRLLRDTDALGMRRVELDWRLQRQDKESAIALTQALDAELRRLNLGEVEPSEWLSDEQEFWRSDPNVSAHPFGGFHHIGTTSMADEPSRGVTDGWGRVHGIENLYLAGSSLFPTSGWANPTLTILALSLRTADRLLSVINKPKPVLRPVLPLPEVDASIKKHGTGVRAA
jgi:choline dehydrogenase-like flavoprotein